MSPKNEYKTFIIDGKKITFGFDPSLFREECYDPNICGICNEPFTTENIGNSIMCSYPSDGEVRKAFCHIECHNKGLENDMKK